jgi:hypothetical protein
MESTFLLKPEDLNAEFIENLKKLFGNARQLQLTISTSEDFGLFKQETGEAYIKRLKEAAKDVEQQKNIVEITEEELDEMVLSRLR